MSIVLHSPHKRFRITWQKIQDCSLRSTENHQCCDYVCWYGDIPQPKYNANRIYESQAIFSTELAYTKMCTALPSSVKNLLTLPTSPSSLSFTTMINIIPSTNFMVLELTPGTRFTPFCASKLHLHNLWSPSHRNEVSDNNIEDI